jgi:thymidylate synthase ThyX
MRVIEPSVEVYFHYPNRGHLDAAEPELDTPESFLERVGRTCYKSEDRITTGSARKFIEMLDKRGHKAMLEHCVASVKFVCDRGCCYDDVTEVLTRRGWISFSDVDKSTELAGLTDDGELVYERPSELQAFHFRGDMLAFASSSVDLCVTPNHRMWVFDHNKRSEKTRRWKFIEAREMVNSRYKINKTATWRAEDRASVVVPAHHTKSHQFPEIVFSGNGVGDLFELLGVWATDGSARDYAGSGQSLYISQRKSHVIKRVHELCRKLGLRFTDDAQGIRIDNARMLRFAVGWFGRLKPDRRVPSAIRESSASQIRRFLRGVELGDGNKHGSNGHVVVYTVSTEWAGDLQELYLKSGMAANVRSVGARTRRFPSGRVSDCKPSFVVSVYGQKRSVHLLNRKSARRFGEKVAYDGVVYCATVPTGRLYVRRNGKACWSGNSHELVRHRLASFAMESTRYCNYAKDKFNNQISVIEPPFTKEGSNRIWRETVQVIEDTYMRLTDNGEPPQLARAVLPISLKTEIWATANLREWQHIFNLRCAKAAHPQIRALMLEALEQFAVEIPPMFEPLWEKYGT